VKKSISALVLISTALCGMTARAGESPYTGAGAPTEPVPYYCYSVVHLTKPDGDALYYYHSDITRVAITKQNELNKAWRDHVASIQPGAFAGPNLCFVVDPAFDPPTKAGDNLERQWKERGAQIMAPDWKYEPGQP
jgi:hypothetical protein